MKRFSVFVLCLCASCVLTGRESTAQRQQETADVSTAADAQKFEGRTIAEWIGDWDENTFQKNQAAIRVLAAAGKPAAEEMNRLIKNRHRHAGFAFQTLGKMGEPARVALPTLIELANDKSVANPDGWTWNTAIRTLLISELRNMPWAANELVPVLERVANDKDEDEQIRTGAIAALGRMGAAAGPILKGLAKNENNKVRSVANDALVEVAVAGGRAKADAYEELILANPLDPNVPEYLVKMRNIYNSGELNPVAQRAKSAIRKQLAEKPDAELAFTLATIIRNSLANTDLEFAAPSDSYRSQSAREDPAENYTTLADAIEIALNHAPKDSDLALRSGRSLARLRLLQGDWVGMNAALSKIGQPPVAAEARANLPAPPFEWTSLQKDWQPADASMTGGTAAIEFEFEKDGKPLAGAHVLVKRAPPPEDGRIFRTGINVNTLLYATQPLETRPYDAFGYRGNDRAVTRYAVTDATGKVRIEHLPAGAIVVEALIPTSNFTELGKNWDLLMETVPGELHPTWIEMTGIRGSAWQAQTQPIDERPRLSSVSRRDGPAVVTLKADETVKYPKFVVRQQLALNVSDWASVDANDFILWWGAASGEQDFDHYEVEMMLTAPQQTPDYLPSQRVIKSTTTESIDTHWNVAKDGVGGQRLQPGNVYMFEVRAVDRNNKVLARLPRTRVWTPWPNRKSQPPEHAPGARNEVPFYDQMWWNSGMEISGGPRIDNRQRIEEFLAGKKDSFEYEYVEMGKAWLQCLDKKVEDGRKTLERLAKELPEGNVARATCRMLLQKLDAGQELPKRLEFVDGE